MIEIINGNLLTYFTVLCVLSSAVSYILKPIWILLGKPTQQERHALSEINNLKFDQSTLSMKDDFSAYSKLQRRIIRLEMEYKELAQTRASNNMKIKWIVTIAAQTVLALVMLVSSIWCRYEPLVQIKADLSPLSSILSYPTQYPNAISAHMWVIILNYSVRFFIKKIAT